MEIEVTTKRQCCQHDDLKQYWGCLDSRAVDVKRNTLFFCIHCGQIWRMGSEGPVGFMKLTMVKVEPNLAE